MDPLTLMALATLASTAFGMKKQSDMQAAAKGAAIKSEQDAQAKQSELTAKGFAKRREAQGATLLGSSASETGKSLLG